MQQAQQIAIIQSAAELAIDGGEVSPEDFYAEYAPQIDPDILKKIAGVPFGMVFSALKQYLPQESPLFSIAGKSWLTELHAIIKAKNS
jgi:hypothetical protein